MLPANKTVILKKNDFCREGTILDPRKRRPSSRERDRSQARSTHNSRYEEHYSNSRERTRYDRSDRYYEHDTERDRRYDHQDRRSDQQERYYGQRDRGYDSRDRYDQERRRPDDRSRRDSRYEDSRREPSHASGRSRQRVDYLGREKVDLAPRKRRSGFWSFYRILTIISAIIVILYLGFKVAIKPPQPIQSEQVQPAEEELVKPEDLLPKDPNALERRKDVYTILLAATDAEGFRTDTMMVMTYDVKNQKVGVVSVPRDTITQRPQGKNPRLVYGPGGVEERREDISKMLGIPLDYYVKVDIRGFIALVDYLGGIEFYVPCDMNYDDPYQNLSIHFKEGTRNLTGKEAMQVARFRKNNDHTGYTDVGRTQTQQALLVALAEKVLSWNSLPKMKGFIEIFNEYVDTNLKISDMMYFAAKALELDPATGVETTTLEGKGNAKYHGHKYCYELDREKALDTINRLINPYTRDLTLDDMNLIAAEGYIE